MLEGKSKRQRATGLHSKLDMSGNNLWSYNSYQLVLNCQTSSSSTTLLASAPDFAKSMIFGAKSIGHQREVVQERTSGLHFDIFQNSHCKSCGKRLQTWWFETQKDWSRAWDQDTISVFGMYQSSIQNKIYLTSHIPYIRCSYPCSSAFFSNYQHLPYRSMLAIPAYAWHVMRFKESRHSTITLLVRSKIPTSPAEMSSRMDRLMEMESTELCTESSIFPLYFRSSKVP